MFFDSIPVGIEANPGGCFCERLPGDGGARHVKGAPGKPDSRTSADRVPTGPLPRRLPAGTSNSERVSWKSYSIGNLPEVYWTAKSGAGMENSSNEIFVAKASELKEGERKIVGNRRSGIGVYRFGGKLVAYENLCPHQGGPACEGLVMPRVEEVILPDRTCQGMRFNYDQWHIICPWHGWEYDLLTGEMVADRKFKLRKYPVVERGDEIYVVA